MRPRYCRCRRATRPALEPAHGRCHRGRHPGLRTDDVIKPRAQSPVVETVWLPAALGPAGCQRRCSHFDCRWRGLPAISWGGQARHNVLPDATIRGHEVNFDASSCILLLRKKPMQQFCCAGAVDFRLPDATASKISWPKISRSQTSGLWTSGSLAQLDTTAS